MPFVCVCVCVYDMHLILESIKQHYTLYLLMLFSNFRIVTKLYLSQV